MRIDIGLVGIGGYGGTYLQLFQNHIDPSRFRFVGCVDPAAERAPGYAALCEQGVPIYASLDAFYQEHTPDLMILSTPVQFHCEQTIYCLQHGSHVLCEKPIAPTLQEAMQMEQVAKEQKKLLGIGFQWSYAPPILQAKQDILRGVYGKPLQLSAYISWKRYDAYYRSGWKGRWKDSKGRWILDTVVSNATAHYLHNAYFMLGDRLETSEAPLSMNAMLLRAKDIESYDTCLLQAKTAKAPVLFIATHAANELTAPTLCYTFEKGRISMNLLEESQMLIGETENGVIRYGDPQQMDNTAEKVIAMLDAIEHGTPLTCTVETALPHLRTVNALAQMVPVHGFPSRVFRENDEGTFVEGLGTQLRDCFDEGRLPHPGEFDWVTTPTTVSLTGFQQFDGVFVD